VRRYDLDRAADLRVMGIAYRARIGMPTQRCFATGQLRQCVPAKCLHPVQQSTKWPRCHWDPPRRKWLDYSMPGTRRGGNGRVTRTKKMYAVVVYGGELSCTEECEGRPCLATGRRPPRLHAIFLRMTGAESPSGRLHCHIPVTSSARN
jgi:hypothetical protein